jgi:hypothetical protein
MKLENQVTSLKLSKKLKELGVKQESLFYWSNARLETMYEDEACTQIINYEEFILTQYVPTEKGSMGEDEIDPKKIKCYSAFTVAELGQMLPEKAHKGLVNADYRLWSGKVPQDGKWELMYINNLSSQDYFRVEADTEANARAKMLIYLLENKLI